jgi:hypothetical protein
LEKSDNDSFHRIGRIQKTSKVLLKYSINIIRSFLVSKISSFQERTIIILAANINKFDVSEEDRKKVVINERENLNLTLIPNVLDM